MTKPGPMHVTVLIRKIGSWHQVKGIILPKATCEKKIFLTYFLCFSEQKIIIEHHSPLKMCDLWSYQRCNNITVHIPIIAHAILS